MEHRIKYIKEIKKLCTDIHLENLLKEDIFDENIFMKKMNNVTSREDYVLLMERLIYYKFGKRKHD